MQEYELTIESLDHNGCGQTFKGNKTILVENTLPGDVIKANGPERIRQKKTKMFLANFLSHGIPRISQTCYYADQCGGCKFQDIDYTEQLKLKANKVKEAFAILTNISLPPIPEIIGAPSVFHYRNKMEFSFSHKRWLTATEIKENTELKKDFALGMHTPYTFDKIIDLKECFLQTTLTPKIINFVRDFCLKENLQPYNSHTAEGFLRFLVIKESTYTDEVMVNLITKSDDPENMNKLGTALKKEFPQITSFYHSIHSKLSQIAAAEESHLIYGSPNITDKILGLNFEISPFSFFQPNTKAAEIVYNHLLKIANFQGNETVLDLYCGVGSISLTVSKKVKKVIGFEIVPEAVSAAIRNQQLNNIENCEFYAGDLNEIVKTHPAFQDSKFDTLILDPPRSGLHPNVIKKILELNIPTIIYVSCNPVSQANNLNLLCFNNTYKVTHIQPIDMLPNTYHVENIVKLERATK